MVAGRYPIFPESPLTTLESLELWSKHPVRACRPHL